ncbi:MAG: ADP-ribosylglycohydrolase family protein [Methanomicrobiales archaeon]|nr:ADP-ribosylglycohydrolase family protein [Methanomicrobiales archaeon]
MGSFLGLAVGDALGAPLEGLAAPSERICSMIGGGVHNLKKGECTDDTLQAVALARSLILCRSLDPDDLIPRLLEGYRERPYCYGPTSSAAFQEILAGTVPQGQGPGQRKETETGRTNGSIMRGLPLGIFFPPGEVREPSLACSRITHPHAVAGECSAFVNTMISFLCRGARKEEAYRNALTRCESAELRPILEQYEHYPLTPSMDAVWTTHCAVRILLESADFTDALITAVNLGGDADTIGSVSGALAGAAWGVDAIPSDWLVCLQDHCDLRSLARDLVKVAYD